MAALNRYNNDLRNQYKRCDGTLAGFANKLRIALSHRQLRPYKHGLVPRFCFGRSQNSSINLPFLLAVCVYSSGVGSGCSVGLTARPLVSTSTADNREKRAPLPSTGAVGHALAVPALYPHSTSLS